MILSWTIRHFSGRPIQRKTQGVFLAMLPKNKRVSSSLNALISDGLWFLNCIVWTGSGGYLLVVLDRPLARKGLGVWSLLASSSICGRLSRKYARGARCGTSRGKELFTFIPVSSCSTLLESFDIGCATVWEFARACSMAYICWLGQLLRAFRSNVMSAVIVCGASNGTM